MLYLIDILAGHPDAGVVMILTLYLAYEIRFGKIEDVRERQELAADERHIVSMAVYRIIREYPEFDEDQYRDLLWEDEEVFPKDFDAAEERLKENIRRKEKGD